MIILSNSLVLSAAEEALPDGTPWIGYHDLVETTNITSTTEDSTFPVTNLANHATHLKWIGTATTGYELLTVTTNYVDDVDYVGIAKHNFGTNSISVTVDGSTENDTFTKILLHMDGTDAATTFTDSNSGGSAHTWTAAGNANTDTAQFKFGPTSLALDGTGDWVTTPDHADFNLGSSDFTIDFWVRISEANGTAQFLAGQADAGFTTATSSFGIERQTDNTIKVVVCVGAAQIASISTSTVLVDTWVHIAAIRSGNTLSVAINGSIEGTTALVGTINNSADALRVGALGEVTATPLQGWIDEFRLSVGIARWTSAFTPPTVAYDEFEWDELVQETIQSNDWPIIARFTPQPLARVRVRLGLNGVAPQAAVVYVGKLLVLERSITIGRGHVPITYGRRTSIVTGMSESGNFLGRIVLGEHRESKAEFEWFQADFYRSDIDQFLEAAQVSPFFWAWSPEEYPQECGYVWLTKNSDPEVDPVTRRVALTLEMRGIA